ncbi:hypothetical protein FRC04_003772 [Tulasnella sp. 424]|nr:hypothetical protein FRC04_003772 [Tulasnella sp. 424]
MEAARELLDKRGFIYADRPRWVMAGELMGKPDTSSTVLRKAERGFSDQGLDSLTPLSRSNPAWRKHRSLLKHSLSPQVVKRDYSIQLTKKAHQYLHCLLTRPEDFLVDLGRYCNAQAACSKAVRELKFGRRCRIVAENVVELTYGNRTDDKGRDLVKLNYHIMHTILPGMQGYIVDMLPVLRHLPSWLPGMNFKRDAAKWKAEIDEAKQTIFGFAKRSLATANPSSDSSFMTNNLRELYQKHEDSIDVGQIEEDELAISNSGFSFFLAGVETEKAHAEIDAVVGSQRLPTFDDQQNMPYLHAVLLETLRWNPVVPMGKLKFRRFPKFDALT